MTMQLLGEVEWSMETDQEGHRDYTIIWLVETDDPLDGPGKAWDCPDLPREGDPWRFGNDDDQWALCWPNNKIKPIVTNSPNYWFTVEQFFSTRLTPFGASNVVYHPWEMPAKVRCHFTKYTEEAWRDRNGEIIVSSSFERLGGKQVEFDKGSPAVSITMNILPASTESSLKRFSDLMDCVNDRPLWGWKPRMVKFSDITYELMYYGNYSILSATLDFEIKTRRITQDNQTDVVSGHDRDVLDAGWKIRTLGTDGTKPEHYQSNKNPADKDRSMIFYGDPNNDATRGYAWKYAGQKKDTMNKIRVEYYNEANLFTLGIPVDIDNPVGRSSGSEGEPPPP